jgi:hypothetical protein
MAGVLMSLSDLASLGSFVSGFAVLVSLVFLYFQLRQVNQQVRQAERNQRAAVTQGSVGRGIEIVLGLTDPSLSETHFRAMSDASDLSGAEVLKLMNVVIAFASNAQEAWVQRRHGLIDEIPYELQMRMARTVFTAPTYRAIWPMARAAFPREFGEVFQKEIERLPLREPIDLARQFKSNRAALDAK